MKPTINKETFLEWYFDYDTKKSVGFDLVDELIQNGSISRSVEDIFKQCGYIPAYLCENVTEEQKEEEFEPSEVTLID
jgi:hypothetical protein